MATQLRQHDQIPAALGGRTKLRRLVRDYQNNLHAYSVEYRTLVENHLHKWVVFDKGKRIAIDPSYAAVRKRAERHGKVSAAAVLRYVEKPGQAHFH